MPTKKRPTEYRAPALEKGLDILELLAHQDAGLTLSEIADSLERSKSELFRMLDVLTRRGYIEKSEPGDTYSITPMLFELAHLRSPTKRLLDAALPEMRALADDTGQSCHLAIRYGVTALIIAQVDSPSMMGFSVRVGSRVPMLETGSGHVLLAYLHADSVARWQAAAREEGVSAKSLAALPKTLARIRKRGHEAKPSAFVNGVVDLATPIRDQSGTAVAALTVPYLLQKTGGQGQDQVLERLHVAADRIARHIGGIPLSDDG